MKKSRFLLFFLCLLLAACGKAPAPALPDAPVTVPEQAVLPVATDLPAGTVAEPETDAETAAAPELPALAFFADMGARTFEPLSSYSARWERDKDILCLGVKPQGGEGSSYQALWGAAFAAYPDLARYRLGFLVSYTLVDGRRFDLTVLSPADTEGAFTDYLDIYLYDDYHQTPGVWYSHVEKSAYTAKTTLTSIKLTGRAKIAEAREIVLSAFFYTEDDLDAAGRFTGLPALTLPIGKEN